MSFEVIVHEIAHAYGDEKYGDAPDVSENFEAALTEVAGKALGFTVRYSDEVRRTLHGGFGAIHHMHMELQLRKLLQEVAESLVEKYNVKLSGLDVLAEYMVDKLLPRRDNPPVYIVVTFEVSSHNIDIHRQVSGWKLSTYSERKYDEYMKTVKESAMRSFKELKTYGKPTLALVYDPKTDKYIVVADEGIWA